MPGRVQLILGVILAGLGAAWRWPLAEMLAGVGEALPAGLGDSAPTALILAGGLYGVTGLLTMAISGVANMTATGRNRKAAAVQLDLFHELLTGATVRMVGADGVITPAEMSMVSGVLEKFGQTPVPDKTIRSIAQAARKNPTKYVNLIASKQSVLSDEQKTQILRACLLVAMADVTVDESEIEYLQSIASALKVSAERLVSIRDELTNVTQKLVGAAAFAV